MSVIEDHRENPGQPLEPAEPAEPTPERAATDDHRERGEGWDRRAALGAIGRAIARRRSATGLSQEQASERCGFHRTYLGSIERGRKNPPTTTLLRIAQVLGCRASELLADAGY